jgi:predicted dehydrogenase
MRLGLIGAGKHGSRYARHIRGDFPDLRLVALARRDAAKAAAAAAEFGCRTYLDYRELIADREVEAVIVVVPPALHAEIVTAAAAAGRAVLLEKPAAIGVEQGRAMLATLRRHGTPLMVAQTLRYNAVVQALRARLPAIGPIHALSLSQGFEPSLLAWLDDPTRSGGGITLHTGVHSFDLVRFLTGSEAETVACHMARIHTQRTEDTFAAAIRLGGGTLATVTGCRAIGGRTGHIEIGGEWATLVGDHVTHRAYEVVGTQARPIEIGEPVPTVRAALGDFVRALRAGAPMPIPFEEGLRAVAIACACYRAAESGHLTTVEAV